MHKKLIAVIIAGMWFAGVQAEAQDNPTGGLRPTLQGRTGEAPNTVELRIWHPPVSMGGQPINGFDVLVHRQSPSFTALYRIYGTDTSLECVYGVIDPGSGWTDHYVVGIEYNSPCDAKIPSGWTLPCGTESEFTIFPLDDSTYLSNTVLVTTLPCQ